MFFIVARDLLGAYTETWLLWYGLLFMAVVLFKPKELLEWLSNCAIRLRRRTTDAAGEAHRLHKRFGQQIVLDDVSFTVDTGELAGIIGPNGAGKTTFFNVLTGSLSTRARARAV